MMKSILVIDDNKDIRENTAEILDLAGYKTFTAENGKKGVEAAMHQKPDLIVCDITGKGCQKLIAEIINLNCVTD